MGFKVGLAACLGLRRTADEGRAGRLLTAGTALAALAAAALATQSGSSSAADQTATEAKRACAVRGATVAASRTARLSREDNDGIIRYFACSQESRRPATYIGYFEGITCGLNAFALNGDYIAWHQQACKAPEEAPGTVVLYDVVRRTKRVIRANRATLTDLEVTPRGSVVWIADRPMCPGLECRERVVEVRAFFDGRQRVLDSGTEIDRASLGLSGPPLQRPDRPVSHRVRFPPLPRHGPAPVIQQ